MLISLKVLWHWHSMGPYHFARMRALARVPAIELTVVESASTDDHGWIRAERQNDVRVITLSSETKSKRVLKNTQAALAEALDEHRPHIVVASGYAEPHSLRTMMAYKKSNRNTLTLLWSESTKVDHSRM